MRYKEVAGPWQCVRSVVVVWCCGFTAPLFNPSHNMDHETSYSDTIERAGGEGKYCALLEFRTGRGVILDALGCEIKDTEVLADLPHITALMASAIEDRGFDRLRKGQCQGFFHIILTLTLYHRGT